MSAIWSKPTVENAVTFGFMIVFQVKMTSRAVNGAPSCHFTPGRSLTVNTVPSFEMPPFFCVGISRARFGTKLPFGSTRQRSSKIAMCTPRWVSIVGITGLKFCGSCEIPTMICPPFCGVGAGCADARRAATPALATSEAAPRRTCRRVMRLMSGLLSPKLHPNRGSNASRNPSPAKLKLSTVRLIMAPG